MKRKSRSSRLCNSHRMQRVGIEWLEPRYVLDNAYALLRQGDFQQDWTDVSTITPTNKWQLLLSIIGYSGTGLVASAGVDPQTIVADGGTELVTANQTSVTGTGGITAVGSTIRVVTVKPTPHTGTKINPYLVIHVNTTNVNDVRVRYKLQDYDTGNVIQAFALQIRVGDTGNWINVPAGYVADATDVGTGKVTFVDATLPADANNQPKLQIRIITCDAVGTDEWVGIDDIVVSGNRAPRITLPGEPVTYTENTSPVILQPDATIADADSPIFDSGTLRISILNASDNDRLEIRHEGNGAGQIGITGSDVAYGGVTIGTFTGGAGMVPLAVTFNAAATRTAVETLVRNLVFRTLGDNPATADRLISITVSDGDGGTSAAVETTLHVAAVNDAPTLTLAPLPIYYTAGSAALIVAPEATMTDADATMFDLATLNIAITNGQPGDLLEVRHEGNGGGQIGVSGNTIFFGGIAIGSLSTSTGLAFSFHSTATLAGVQQLLRNITFRNSLTSAAVGSRTISATFLEGDGTSVSANLQVIVLAAPPQLSIADAMVSEGASGSQTLSFVVTLSENPSSNVVVTYATQDDTATTADNDYEGKTGTLTFSPGGPLLQSIEILVRADAKYELSERLFVDITDVTNAVASDTRAVGTIDNDDALPTLTIQPASVVEGNSGNTTLLFVVELSHPSYQPITISYESQDDTATVSGGDYLSTTGAMVFAPGDVSKSIAVTVMGDFVVEPAEAFHLVGSSAGGISNATAQGIGTILNDDQPPTVSVALHPESDTGVTATPATSSDRITRDNTPIFLGSSQSGATIRLYIDADGDGVLTVNDTLLAQATASAADAWQASVTTALPDGQHRILATATDAVGNVSDVQSLVIVVDTQAPLVDKVFVTSHPDYALLASPGIDRGVTPLVSGISVRVADLPVRAAPFALSAFDYAQGITTGVYQLVGEFTGNVGIADVSFQAVGPGIDSVVVMFSKPLADDLYTLTIGGLVDVAGNPLATSVFTFTVDSRPEVAAWASSGVDVDMNGNGFFDSVGIAPDVHYALSLAGGAMFAGNFALLPSDVANGFDKLAAYTQVTGQFQFNIDVDSDGVPDNEPGVLPAVEGVIVLSVSGTPIAGRFDNNDANGDEVGVFDGTTWYFDTNHNLVIDGDDISVASTLRGQPVVGDFDGDGFDDLATFDGTFCYFDLTNGTPRGWDGTADWKIQGTTGTPGQQAIVADFDRDGVDDVGLWAPALTPGQTIGEWFVILSDGGAIAITGRAAGDPEHRVVIDPDSGLPAFMFSEDRDLAISFGDVQTLPVAGNFDRPFVAQPGVAVGAYTNTVKPWDVDGDGMVAPNDALLLINALNLYGSGVLTSTMRSENGPYLDVSGDRVLNPLDALMIINYLNDFGAGEGEDSVVSPFAVPTPAPDALTPGWWIPLDLWLEDEQDDELVGLLAEAAAMAAI